ncbi:MAG: class II aldolase/adducin family protein [Deltaproteobacteria bacterium]|nr:MAG: class II aldolase/adducin family protein [Deltaproteobacteria bacterium]
MSRSFLLGLDFGGGGARCLLVEVESGSVVTASRRSPFAPAAGMAGVAGELDAEALWRLLGEASHEVLARAGASPEEISGIAATSMRFSLVVLDRDGSPIFALPNADGRAVVQAAQLAADCGELLHRRTGHWPAPVMLAPRLRWLRSERPELFDRAAKAVSLGDWVAFRLCGELVTDPSQAGETLLFELASPRWAEDLADRLEIPRSCLPEVRAPGTPLGPLAAAPAEALGLRAGIPVAVGGGDTQCGLLGAGVVEPGGLAAIAGTTTPVEIVLDAPRVDPDARLWSGHHVVSKRWVLESNAGVTGGALAWFARLLFPNEAYPVAHLVAEAAQAPIGSAGILSSVGAGVMNARELGFPVGSVWLSHLSLGGAPAERRHLARAALEGIACGLRANVEQVVAASGAAPSALRLAGGMARSRLFADIAANVLDTPVEVPASAEASALGAAICAGVGAGVFRDLAEGAARLVRVERTHPPDAARSAAYAECYQRFVELRSARTAADAIAAGSLIRGSAQAPRSPAAAAAEPSFRPRILVTADFEESGLRALRALGDVTYASYREVMRLLTGGDLVKALEGFHVFITEVDVVDADALAKLPDLRVVASCRGEAVNVDIAACTAYGVPVLNAPGRNADAVADLTAAYVLMLARKLPEANAFLRQPDIEAGDMGRMGQAHRRFRGHELWHKTVGLVGFGAVGRRVARRLRAFEARILVYDPFVSEESLLLEGAEASGLEALLAQSDFVSLHAPVTDDTRGMIGASEFARMKDGAFLVNTARAALVDEDALFAALDSGKLAGAAIDVFAVEPPGSGHPLLAHANVVATPHVGGNTYEVAAHQGQIVSEDLARMLRGETPRNLRNPETLEHFRWEGPRPEPDAETLAQLARGPGAAVTDLDRDARKPRTRPAAAKRERAEVPATAAEIARRGPAARETEEHMKRLIENFLERAARDEGLRAAADKDLTLQFHLTDAGLKFYLGFEGGEVVAGMGEPEPVADVQLKMKADVFDGMFTGTLSGMEAATSGRLSFSGDTAKAMALQSINRDIARIYESAVAEVGAPDLSAFAAGAAPAAAAVASTDIRHELVRVVNELFAIQLITATGGNVSVRSPGEDNEVWITPSQLYKGDLSPEILVRIDLDGNALDEDARSASSERLVHTAIYKAKPEAKAVIHAHAPHATILANTDLPFLPISTEAAFFSDIPRVPFIMPGTAEVADACAKAMAQSWAVLLKNHGLVVAGRSLRRAADMVEIVERTAEVILGCYAVGREPPVLPEDVVKTLRQMGDLIA